MFIVLVLVALPAVDAEACPSTTIEATTTTEAPTTTEATTTTEAPTTTISGPSTTEATTTTLFELPYTGGSNSPPWPLLATIISMCIAALMLLFRGERIAQQQ